MTVDEAKKILRDNGYFVDNLWNVCDVKLLYNCEDDNQAQQVLSNALTNDATMEQIWFAIDVYAEDMNLIKKD